MKEGNQNKKHKETWWPLQDLLKTLILVLLFFNKPIFSPFGFPKIPFWYKTSFILFFSSWFDFGERKSLESGGRERKHQLTSLMTPE
jgi:hypothetical protein